MNVCLSLVLLIHGLSVSASVPSQKSEEGRAMSKPNSKKKNSVLRADLSISGINL